MHAHSFAIFDTAIGTCAIAWGARGVTGVWLPRPGEADDSRACLVRRLQPAEQAVPPADVQRAIDGIVALLRGEASDLSTVELDMQGLPPFHCRVYAIARSIAPGATLTYGEIAQRLGEPGSARLVGQALGSNPFPIIVPCHRVLAAGGRMGGFSAPGGVATKLRLLHIEGARINQSLPLFD